MTCTRLTLLFASLTLLVSTGCHNSRAEKLLNQPEDFDQILGPVDVDDDVYFASEDALDDEIEPEVELASAPPPAPDAATQTVTFDGPDAEPEPTAPIGGMQPKRRSLGSLEIFGISNGGPG